MKITHIDDLWPAVQDKPEFVRIERDGYMAIDYVYLDEMSFNTVEALECRGIKFDSDGNILARPFAKFFNYGERLTDLPIDEPHVVMHKLDGSMIHPAMVNGELLLMTRKGHTDVAKRAEDLFMRKPDYFSFMHSWLNWGFTPIFEFVGPTNRIVLRYDEHRLVLVALRHTINGTYIPYEDMVLHANSSGIDVVGKPQEFSTISHLGAFLDHTKYLVDEEGYVVRFDNGHMVKIKALDYITKHRALDDLGSKKKVTALCLQGFMDDVLPILDDPDKEELKVFHSGIMLEAQHYVQGAEMYANGVRRDGSIDARKNFALKLAPNLRPTWLAGVVFGILDGGEARPMVLDSMRKHLDTIKTDWRGQ